MIINIITLNHPNFHSTGKEKYNIIHKEYCNTVWKPKLIKDEDNLEKVQQQAIKLIPAINHLSYPERLQELMLPTLEYRRQRADQIQLYKIMTGREDVQKEGLFSMSKESRTRGHIFNVEKPHCKTSVRQRSLAVRSLNNWNGLPKSTVQEPSINSFKSELEKHWHHHPL